MENVKYTTILNHIKKRWKTIVCNSLCIYLFGCTTHQVTRNMWGGESSGCFDSGYKSSDYLDNEQIASSASNEDQVTKGVKDMIEKLEKILSEIWDKTLEKLQTSEEENELKDKLKSEVKKWNNLPNMVLKSQLDSRSWNDLVEKLQNSDLKLKLSLIPYLAKWNIFLNRIEDSNKYPEQKVDLMPKLLEEWSEVFSGFRKKNKDNKKMELLNEGFDLLVILHYGIDKGVELLVMSNYENNKKYNKKDYEDEIEYYKNNLLDQIKEWEEECRNVFNIETPQECLVQLEAFLSTLPDLATNTKKNKPPIYSDSDEEYKPEPSPKRSKEKNQKDNSNNQNRSVRGKKRQYNSKNNNQERGYVSRCSICKRIFKNTSGLKIHETIVHREPRLFECSYPGCEKSYRHSCNLRRHQKKEGHICAKNQALGKKLRNPFLTDGKTETAPFGGLKGSCFS